MSIIGERLTRVNLSTRVRVLVVEGMSRSSAALSPTSSEGSGGTMAERVLRGSRLGTTSYETDRNTDLAPRHDVTYDCPRGHTVSVPMASEAELPPTWECKVCGGIALLRDGVPTEAKKTKHVRTHWDMLL